MQTAVFCWLVSDFHSRCVMTLDGLRVYDCLDNDDDGNALEILDGNELGTQVGVPIGYPDDK